MIQRIPKSYVLVEVSCLRHKKINFQSGTEIIIDPTFHPEQHAETHGIVKAIPDNLYFKHGDVMDSMEMLISIDVKVNDKVYFHYLQINEALRQKKIIEEDGKIYIFIRHDSLFCGIRDGNMIMFNGWILLEPLEVMHSNSNVLSKLPKNRIKKDTLKGKIVHIGNSVKEYFYNKHESDKGIDVSLNDTVIFLPDSDIPLEYKMHQDLDKVYFRVQRKDLLAKYED